MKRSPGISGWRSWAFFVAIFVGEFGTAIIASRWLPFWAALGVAFALTAGVIVAITLSQGAIWTRTNDLPSGPWVHLTSPEAAMEISLPDGSAHIAAVRPRSGPLFWPLRLGRTPRVFWYAGTPTPDRIRASFPSHLVDDLVAFVVDDPPDVDEIAVRRSDGAISTEGDYLGPARRLRRNELESL